MNTATATVYDFTRPAAPRAFRFFPAGLRTKVRRALELLATPYLVEGARYL